MLLEDDRFLLFAAQIYQAVAEEMYYVESLPISFFAFFNPFIGQDIQPECLRDDIVYAARRTLAFIYKDAFHQHGCYPLSLTQGNIEQNLQALMAHRSDTIKDQFAQQMNMAISCGMAQQRAVKILNGILQSPCTTNMVEQVHGLSTTAMNAHSRFCELSLIARQVIHSARGSLDPSLYEQKLDKIDAKITCLEAKLNKRFKCKEYAGGRTYEVIVFVFKL